MRRPLSAQRLLVLAAAVGLMAAGLGSAPTQASPTSAAMAVTTLQPKYASDDEAPAQTYAAFIPTTGAGNRTLPPERTETELAIREPAGSTGVVRDPATLGTVTMTSERTIDDPQANSRIQSSSIGSRQTTSTPDNYTMVSDFWLQNFYVGAWTYTFDFSNLRGGVLPVGSSLNSSDVDVCTGRREQVTMTADTPEPWMTFDFHREINGTANNGTKPTVTFDDVTGSYQVTASDACTDINMNDWFTTTRPIKSLSVDIVNPHTAAFVYFGMRTPTATPEPDISLVKKTNDVDVTGAPGPELEVGDEVTWEYSGTNTGNTALADVTITDDRVDSTQIDCGNGTNVIGVLAVGEDYTCTATGEAIQGQYVNNATVTGTPSTSGGVPLAGSDAVSAEDTSWYHAGVESGLSISKVVDLKSASAGDELTYDLTAKNLGEVDLAEVTITDTLPKNVTVVRVNDGGTREGRSITWNLGTLAPEESKTVSVVVRVLKAANGSTLVNTAGAASPGVPGEPTTQTVCEDDPKLACAATEVDEPSVAPSATDPSPGGPGDNNGDNGDDTAGGVLPDTGSPVGLAMVLLAAALIAGGTSVVFAGRRRRTHP